MRNATTAAPRRPRRADLRLPATLLAAVLLAAAAPRTVAAEPAADAARYLEQTEDILARVGPLVHESDSEQARRIMRDALDRQRDAHGLYDQQRYLIAVRVSQRARDLARQAARLAGSSQSYQERVQQRLERLRDLHDSVSERARDEGNAQAMRFVREFEDLFARAREQAQQTHWEQSFRLLQAAEKSLRRAARLLFEQGGAEHLRREIESTADLIALATGRLGPGGDTGHHHRLDRAAEALNRARGAVADGEPLLAMNALKHARQLVQQVLRSVGGGPAAATVEAQFASFDARLATVVDQVHAAGVEEATAALAAATGARRRAADAMSKGDRDRALRLVRLALDKLQEAETLSR